MTTWLTPEEILDKAKIPVTDDRIRLLRILGHKKKIRWTKTIGCIQYDWDSFCAYREQQAKGKACVVSQPSVSTPIEMGIDSPHTGISSISTDKEVSASLRGIALAQKTKKQKSPSPSSSLSEKGRKPENRVSL